MEGWIKLHRKILNWEWYTDAPVRILFEHLLLTVNYEDKKWKGMTIKRGQKITSYEHLADETGLTVQQVRTAINKLKSTSNLTSKSTNKFTLVTVENYDLYQSNIDTSTSKSTNNLTNEQQTNNNNIRNKRNKEERNIYNFSNYSENDLEGLYEN